MANISSEGIAVGRFFQDPIADECEDYNVIGTSADHNLIQEKPRRRRQSIPRSIQQMAMRQSSALIPENLKQTSFDKRRWLLYGPILASAFAIIFASGPELNQTSFVESAAYTQPRLPNSIEGKQLALHQHQLLVKQAKIYVWDHDIIGLAESINDLSNETQDEASLRLQAQVQRDAPATKQCISTFLDSLLPNIDTVNVTDPYIAKVYLKAMHLSDHPSSVRALGKILTEPVPVEKLVNKVFACASQNQLLISFGCDLIGSNLTNPQIQTPASIQNYLTRMMVLETLTAHAVANAQFAESSTLFARANWHKMGGFALLLSTLKGQPQELKTSLRHKYESVEALAIRLAVDRLHPDSSSFHSQSSILQRGKNAETSAQLNIFESMSIEAPLGFKENAYVGLTLTHGANYQLRHHYSMLENGNQGNKISVPFGKDWADTYIAWNMAYVTALTHPRRAVTAKLFIPAVICTGNGTDGGESSFLAARIYSLYYHLLSTNDNAELTFDVEAPAWKNEYSKRFGKSNLIQDPLPFPTVDDTKLLMNSFPRPDTPFAMLDGNSFQIIVCLSAWLSVVLFGFGMELISMNFLFSVSDDATTAADDTAARNPDEMTGHKRALVLWRIAELAFPIFVTVAFQSRSWFGLPFLAIGLWKFGFPEAISNLIRSQSSDETHLGGASLFCESLGTFIHHTAAAWVICASYSRVLTPGVAHAVTIIATPLVLQHCVTPLKYVSYWGYVIVQLALEVVWEIEIFTVMVQFRYWHEQRAIYGMLVSHWLYLAAGALQFLSKRLTEDNGPLPTTNMIDHFSESARVFKKQNSTRPEPVHALFVENKTISFKQ